MLKKKKPHNKNYVVGKRKLGLNKQKNPTGFYKKVKLYFKKGIAKQTNVEKQK